MGNTEVATKQDFKNLERDLRRDMATKQDLRNVERDLRKDIKNLEQRLTDSTNTKLADLKAELIKYIVSISMGQAALIVSVIIAFMKFMK